MISSVRDLTLTFVRLQGGCRSSATCPLLVGTGNERGDDQDVLAGDAAVKRLVLASAFLLAIFGWLASATSPNPADHLGGKILIGIAAAFVLLALYAPSRTTALVFWGSIAMVVIAYNLPMSFWRMFGLA